MTARADRLRELAAQCRELADAAESGVEAARFLEIADAIDEGFARAAPTSLHVRDLERGVRTGC